MRLKPISAEKANESGGFEPWKAGNYDFTVQEASEGISSGGNEMIKLTLHVFNRDGNKRTVFDYLLATDSSQWKVRHFCDAVGLTKQYEAGELDVNDIVQRSGELSLRIKPAANGYPAGNQVGDYIAGDPKEEKAPVRPAPARSRQPVGATTGVDFDDEIPFAPSWM